MCGLAGFVDLSLPSADAELTAMRAMGAALGRRGPDDEGNWYSPETGVGLVHRRLSIHDLSPLGHQPMASADGRWLLVFNGEIYNFQGLRRELQGEGVAFRSDCDTEVLLEAVARWGVDATLPRLAGMFAFAAFDQASRELWLARDRAGEKPLYYGWQGGRFFFASTVSAMEAHPQFHGEIDLEAVRTLLHYKCIPAPMSIYRGIAKLRPGHRARLKIGGRGAEPKVARYWTLPAAEIEAGVTDAQGLNHLESVLRTVVGEQVSADRTLGAFLSGGIDSSLVVAMMAEVASGSVKTFTIGFDEPGFDEAEHARAVAKSLGTEHHEVYLQPDDALEYVPSLTECYDEPFADSSQLPTLLVSRVARERVVVALSGDGGDEGFGGYQRYYRALAAWQRLSRVPAPLRRSAAAGLAGLARPGIDRWLPPLLATLRIRRSDRSAASALRYWSGFLGSASLDALYSLYLMGWRDAAEVIPGATPEPPVLLGADTVPDGLGPLRSLMAKDFSLYMPDDVLVKVDRASMYFGLEVRAPLLDHRVVEAGWRLPESALHAGGQGKLPLRQLLGRRLPPALFERPKRGFSVPLGSWLRGPLRDWAEDLLSERRLRETGFIEPALVRKRWQQHLQGTWNNSAPVWTVLMLTNWLAARG